MSKKYILGQYHSKALLKQPVMCSVNHFDTRLVKSTWENNKLFYAQMRNKRDNIFSNCPSKIKEVQLIYGRLILIRNYVEDLMLFWCNIFHNLIRKIYWISKLLNILFDIILHWLKYYVRKEKNNITFTFKVFSS